MAHTSKSLRAAIVDRNTLVRNGIRSVLEDDPSINVVGEASSTSETAELLRRKRVDVVLTDFELGDGTALDVCRTVSTEKHKTRVLILTSDKSSNTIRRCVEVGAGGYVLKSSPPQEIIATAHAVANDRMTFGSQLADRVRAIISGEMPASHGALTTRERQVLDQIESGLPNREIASVLGISTRTVDCHVRNVLQKLGVSSRVQAVSQFVRLRSAREAKG